MHTHEKPAQSGRNRRAHRVWIVLAALLTFGPLAPAAELPETSAATQIGALHTARTALQQRLTALRKDPAVNVDRWADAHIFLKGATWALDLEPTLDAQSRGLVQKALDRATERTAALSAGRPNWITQPGRSVRGFVSEVDGSTQPYGLIVPAGYDPSKPIRLDVVLHGSSGSRARGLGELHFMEGYDRGDAGGQTPPSVDFIELLPMGRLGENAYRFEGETDVYESIESVCRNYRIDRSRIVLRGSSLGGVGTWQMGLKRPDRFVALGPAAGPVDTLEFSNSKWPHFIRLDPFTPWQQALLHLVDAIDYVPNARMVPVVAAMGDQDPYYTSHLLVQKAFEQAQIPFVGLVDRGAGHGIGAQVMGEQLRLLGEAATKGLDPAPRQIRFVTWTLKFSRCHWLEILGLGAHYERAEIHADLAPDGSVALAEPRNVSRLAILPPALQGSQATLTVGGKRIAFPSRTGSTNAIVIERRDGGWAYQGERKELVLAGKVPGLQGPMDDAFATKFLCVRGTGPAWNAAAGAWAEANLRRFADEWRRHYRGDLPLKNDTEVTDDDLRSSNLILFGDPGSNRWIREALPQLPARWSRNEIELGSQKYPAANHGLQLICPNPLQGATGHYLVLNSGHTYHDPELRLSYMVFPRLGDWAVMRLGETQGTQGGATPASVQESVVLSGFFDEHWRSTR